MVGLRWTRLSDDERDAFLGNGGTGVISFVRAAEESPAAFPVSYGYVPDRRDFYFRLSFPEGTDKGRFVDHPMTFVTFGETADGWRSVIARGELDELAELPTNSAAIQAMWAVEIPTVDMFDTPREEIPFYDFRLQPTEITGRKEVV